METRKITAGFTIPVLDHGYVRFVDAMGSDQSILDAARISYKSASKGDEADKKLLNYLLKNKHTSPFEMVKIQFNIKLPIFVMRQYVRHRMQNLNEVSARYTELPNEFYIPQKWRKQDTKNKQGSVAEDSFNPVGPSGAYLSNEVAQHCQDSYALYENMLKSGVAREMARMVLPLNIYTEIICCWDLSNLMKFFALRDDSHAQSEIQEYSRAMKQITWELFPWVGEAYDTHIKPKAQ